MTNLNVNGGILAAYPWLKEILAATENLPTRILLVADGILSFGHSSFGLSRLVEVLRQSSRPGAEIIVSTAHRGPKSQNIEAEDYNFKFTEDTLGTVAKFKYEQVWLFGYDSGGVIDESELKVLAEFMNNGGGVFATGDHENLGLALCGSVPRVRSMRKWCHPKSATCVSPAPSRDDAQRHSTVREGRDPGYQASDESDDIPQTIIPRLYQEGCEVNPHALLSFHNTAIKVLPDHMHEGDCIEPTEEQLRQPFELGDLKFDEFPLTDDGKARPAPEIIALSVSSGGRFKEETEGTETFHPPVIPRGFGAICAYDGDLAILNGNPVGRVVVDASFHHFTNLNLDGTGAPFGTGFFDDDGRPTRHYAPISQYFRNIAAYLIPLSRREAYYVRLLALLRFMYPLVEEIRPDEDVENILEVGELTRRALSSYFSPAEANECALALLNSVGGFSELKRLINPRLAALSEANSLAELLNTHACTNAILGGALLSITRRLPQEPELFAERLREIETSGGGLAASVKEGVRRVASIWEPVVEQSLKALDAFSGLSAADET